MVTVKNNQGQIDEKGYWYPLANDYKIPDGTYDGKLIDQYANVDKQGGVYWIDGIVSDKYSCREAIRVFNYTPSQRFEKHTELAKHIERMANTGVTGSGTEWCAFLRELNESVK